MVTNTGNVAIDIKVSGTTMSCDTHGSIPVSNQEYADSTFSHGQGTDLSASSTDWNLNLPKPDSDNPGVSDDTFWQVEVPTGTEGTCTGIITFTAIEEWSCGDTLSYGGDSYDTIPIGDQCWFAENLNVVDGNEDGNCTFTRYCYDSTSSNCDIYGGLYTWADMMCGSSTCNGIDCSSASEARCSSPVQGICPNGWHIPSHHEWTVLEKEVEDDDDDFPCVEDESSSGCYGGDAGQNLKEDASAGHWDSDTGVCNSSGFTLLPAGHRHSDGVGYGNLGTYATLWSSTEGPSDSSHAWERRLYDYHADTSRNSLNKDFGFSVRCLKD